MRTLHADRVPADPHAPPRWLLNRLQAGFASGDALAREAGTSRAAVRKWVEALRGAGVAIEAKAGRGYRLAHPLDLLGADVIKASLPDAARRGLAALDVAWAVDSTNDVLLAQPAPAGATRVLLAETQTAGRGRRGRTWLSPLGAQLAMSLARGFHGGAARLGGLSLVAGVAAAEALEALGIRGVTLKWPNDLVLAEDGELRKLGGILVEGGGEAAGVTRAVVGLGINVRLPEAARARIGQPVADLATICPATPSRNALAAALVSALLPALDAFDAHGLPPFLRRWGERDALAGRAVIVHGPAGDEQATADGIADDGALRVRTSAGDVKHLHAGEVSVRVGAGR